MAPKKSPQSPLVKGKNLPVGPPRTTKRKDQFPHLDTAISVDLPRGTKPSATVAAHIDEPNEDKSGDSGSESRKPVTPVGRRVRFQSPLVSRPKKRRRVTAVDDLETAEAVPDEMWVAVGEDRCKPCKPVEREACEPHWSARGSCKSCVFCRGKSWSCNPPDSWLEKVASMSHPKQPPTKTHEIATDDVQIEAGRISGTAESSSLTTEVARRQKDGKLAQVLLNNDDRLQRIETRLSEIVRHQEGLTSIQRVQQEMRAMLLSLCHNQGIPPSLYSGSSSAAASTSAHSESMVSSRFFPRRLVPNPPCNSQVESDVEGSSQSDGGSSSSSRDTAHGEAGPSAGDPAESPKKSLVEAERTQGSAKAVFLPKVQNGDVEERLRLVKHSLRAAAKDLKEAQAGLLAIAGWLTKITMGLQDVMEILR